MKPPIQIPAQTARRRFILILPLMMVPVALSGCNQPREIVMIRSGALDMCPGIPFGTLVDGYLKGVKWKILVADDGTKTVNISGRIGQSRTRTTTQMTFAMGADADSYRFDGLKIDGEPQGNQSTAELLSAMCRAAGGGKDT